LFKKTRILGVHTERWKFLTKYWNMFLSQLPKWILLSRIPSGILKWCSLSYRDSWTAKRSQWRLLIDPSKVSIKAVLLHNGNKFPSVPLAHAANTKQTY
jgi:hypothetical protein